MILDKQEAYLTTAGSEDLGGTASGVSDYRDLGAKGALDGHRKTYLNIRGKSAHTGGTSPTITIVLTSGADGSTFGQTDATLATTITLAATTNIKIPLPEGMQRYSRIEWTVAGSPTGGGLFNAFLSNS